MTVKEVMEFATDCGFEHVGELNMAALNFMPEIRKMCNSEQCQMYGNSWKCPPAIGTLEAARDKAAAFKYGIIMQTVGQAEQFDLDAMVLAERRHKSRFNTMLRWLRDKGDSMPMSAGSCTICKKCTYPDAPCRYPGKAVPSMEAYGLWVSKVCEESGIKYNYGEGTISYTSCVLF